MRAIDAVATVLAEADGPLHYSEITERMLAKGLWNSRGKTPESTVNARLAVDIRDHGVSISLRPGEPRAVRTERREKSGPG